MMRAENFVVLRRKPVEVGICNLVHYAGLPGDNLQIKLCIQPVDYLLLQWCQ